MVNCYSIDFLQMDVEILSTTIVEHHAFLGLSHHSPAARTDSFTDPLK